LGLLQGLDADGDEEPAEVGVAEEVGPGGPRGEDALVLVGETELVAVRGGVLGVDAEELGCGEAGFGVAAGD
jgi:hypothetical protein